MLIFRITITVIILILYYTIATTLYTICYIPYTIYYIPYPLPPAGLKQFKLS